MMAVPGVPGVAQGAIQGAKYAAGIIKRTVKGTDDPATRQPFTYWDKGSMATISRHHAVAKVGKLEFGGYFAWLAWLFLHLLYLVGFKNRIATPFSWINTFTSHSRGQLTTTSQMVYARTAMEPWRSRPGECGRGRAGGRTAGAGRHARYGLSVVDCASPASFAGFAIMAAWIFAPGSPTRSARPCRRRWRRRIISTRPTSP